MPIELLPHLQLLKHSIPSMRLGPSVHSSRAIPILSRVFPFKLRYNALGPQLCNQFRVRRFTTRSFRPRAGSSSEFSRGGRDRGGEVRVSKSLVDDEAELSDWVSGLRKTDSFRGRVASNDDDLNDRGRDRGKSRDRGGERNRDSFALKRKRESDSDEFRQPSRGRTRNSFESRNRDSPAMKMRRESDSGERSRGRSSNSFDSRNSQGTKRFDSRSNGGDLSFQRTTRGMGNKQRKLKQSSHDDDCGNDDEELQSLRAGFQGLLSEDTEEESDDGDDDILKKSRGSLFGMDKEVTDNGTPSSPEKSDSYLSETRFDQCSVSPLSLKGIKDAGYERMTLVQEATLPVILKGKDVMAKAKTGTGKTVAFLLPSIEVVSKSPPVSRDQKRPPIFVLIICPTRELATQAATEANKLLKYHPSIGVQFVIGGTRLPLEQKRMQANPCQILVATPGRLRDHIENTAGFATRLMGVKVLVLDEADHLLDMGFRKEIEKIIAAVPKQRQTLLFSATVPEEVRQICHIALKRDHEFINAVEEGSEDTHSQVRQMHMVAPLDKHFPLLYVLLKDHIADNIDYKILVFCTTAMVTKLVADLLGELNLNVREIHSRKPQSYRTRVSEEFRKSKGLILVSSDVSARGVDYPDVTFVIQVGVPASREQYIHRLGRTGRKGKEGEGILLLAPWEEFFLASVKELPITKASVPLIEPDTKKKVERALSHVEMKNKESAYQAWLGYYNSNKNVGRDKYKLVELANEFSRSMGLDNPPAIPKLVLGKMGLRNIPGLRTK
ncbi:P-loop containing nucleoside triphosphate hydrolases superfamily protein [Tripterygium wilfordii]|uniref:ATP-dependent RNA helicase n=1 Tax=Tripterygium wilfordii TaxID=458696 RepID=A0A7J7CHJ0_TRIWF|nr:DEAD-box ATP-dependent RNA helicase 31-like [Tripterygium wilfordii]KAF5733522.1 P-loop containing nucleoside triphosphate hydrolases superfamily protein [Tripterygium wilfordii]